ncbi:hypothetical protein GOODEAATRI_031202 [Goodea atripinnis]|uniref:Uncharacterized protein n=1 Tax=Goodea atripinnis TaxID=208336 RepID=A0ABV0NF66_9TELE
MILGTGNKTGTVWLREKSRVTNWTSENAPELIVQLTSKRRETRRGEWSYIQWCKREWLALTAVFVETGPTEGAGRADRVRFAGGSQKSQPEGSIRDSVQTDSLNLWSTRIQR